MRSSFTRVTILAGVSSLALVSAGMAQDAAPEAQSTENPVFVLGTIYLSADDVDGYVASGAQATKSLTPIAESQQSISVVTEDQIADQGAQDLGQALSYTAGVTAQPFGADPRFSAPTMRGFGAANAQYVNGLRQGRLFGAQSYEIYGMQQVEVLRGPSSSLYGSGSPAGVINQVQKRAQSEDAAEVGLGYDSNDSAQAFFDVNRAFSDTLAFRLTGIARDDKTQINELTNERGYLGAALRWNPDDATTIDFLASYTKDSPLSPTGVPYDLTRIGENKKLRDTYTGQSDWDDSDRKMWNIGVEISHELDNGWTLSQGFRYEDLNWEYTGTYVPFTQVVRADGKFERGSNYQYEDSNTLSLDTRLNGEVVTGAATHQLLFGVDVQKYEAFAITHFGTASDFDWRDPDYSDGQADLNGFYGERDITMKQVGVYAQDEVTAGNWRGSFGLRYDWFEQTGTSYGSNVDFDGDKLSGRAGVSYVMENGLSPYLSYSTSFEPQAGTNIDGDELKPSEGKQWEVGVKYQPQDFDGLITVALYDLKQTNVTRYFTLDDVYGAYQIGEVKSRGLEIEGTAEINEQWSVRGAYSYNDTEQKGGNENGNEMPNAPRHLASLWLDRNFESGLRVGGGIRYVGSRFGNEANTYDLKPVTLVDLAAGYEVGNIVANLNVNNLTDEVYVANCGTFGCFYGEGRSLSAKVTYKW